MSLPDTWRLLLGSLGGVLLVIGVVQVVYAPRIHAHYQRANEGTSKWWQNPRGWSVGMVRQIGWGTIVGGVLLSILSLAE